MSVAWRPPSGRVSAAEHTTTAPTGEAHPSETSGHLLVVTYDPAAGSSGQVGAVEEKKEDPPTVNEDYSRQSVLVLTAVVLLVILVAALIDFVRRAGLKR